MAVHKSFASLGRALKELGEDIEEETESVMKTAASEGLKAAVLNTAVDEGTARSNWITSTGQPIIDTRLPFAKGSKLGISETNNAIATINDGNDRLRRYMVKDGPIYISNSVPYIGALDRGFSPQSPGMTMFAVEAVARVFRNAGLIRRRRFERLT